MTCPRCGNPHSTVNERRVWGDEVRRRRKCERCGKPFETKQRQRQGEEIWTPTN